MNDEYKVSDKMNMKKKTIDFVQNPAIYIVNGHSSLVNSFLFKRLFLCWQKKSMIFYYSYLATNN